MCCSVITTSNLCLAESIYDYKELMRASERYQLQHKYSYRASEPIRFFQTRNGRTVGITNQLYITLTSSDSALLADFLIKYDLTLIKPITDNTYLVDSNNRDILPLIGRILEDDNVVNSYPDFIKKVELR